MRVRLTPKSSVDDVGDLTQTVDGPAMALRVRAVPQDGAANAAAKRLVARWLRVPASTIDLISGAKARVKSLAITGDPCRIKARIDDRLTTTKPVPA